VVGDLCLHAKVLQVLLDGVLAQRAVALRGAPSHKARQGVAGHRGFDEQGSSLGMVKATLFRSRTTACSALHTVVTRGAARRSGRREL